MAGVLTVDQWLGGPDQVKVESTFPSSAKTYVYDFGQDVTGWTFELESQTVVVNTIAYDRITGEPNFANSQVVGYFPKLGISTSTNISVVNTTHGVVNVTHPANLYSGPILPDARANVPLTVVSFTWTDNNSPKQINSHRWAKIMAWEPLVTPGDPTLSTNTNYVSLV
jgi:hypothetical protein